MVTNTCLTPLFVRAWLEVPILTSRQVAGVFAGKRAVTTIHRMYAEVRGPEN